MEFERWILNGRVRTLEFKRWTSNDGQFELLDESKSRSELPLQKKLQAKASFLTGIIQHFYSTSLFQILKARGNVQTFVYTLQTRTPGRALQGVAER